MVYDVTVAAVGMVHAFIGVSWFSMSMVAEVVLSPILKKSTKMGELAPLGVLAPKVSMIATVLGLLTILSGFTFLLVKFPLDQFDWLGYGETRAVIAALCTAAAAMAWGLLVTKPAAMGLMKNRPPTPPPPDTPIPEPVKAGMAKVAKISRVQTTIVVLTFVFMVLAIEGGF